MIKPPKCDRCNWKYGGFHVCIDLSTPEPKIRRPGTRFGPMSDHQRLSVQESQAIRRAKEREKTRPRDEKIIQRYKDGGIGLVELGKEFGIAPATANKILKRAEGEGLVKMRRRGHNVAKGAFLPDTR